MKFIVTILMPIIFVLSCKSRDSEIKTTGVTIKHADGSVESPEKDGMRLEVFTGARNSSGITIYFISPLNRPGGFYYSDDKGKSIKEIKPIYSYNKQIFEGEIPIWIEQQKSDSTFIENKFSIYALTPSSLTANDIPIQKSIRGLNKLASEDIKNPFKLGFNDDTFDLNIDLSVTPPLLTFEFNPMDYNMAISGGNNGYFVNGGLNFFCSEKKPIAGWKSTVILRSIIWSPLQVQYPTLTAPAWITELNGQSLKGMSCADAARLIDDQFVANDISLKFETLKQKYVSNLADLVVSSFTTSNETARNQLSLKINRTINPEKK